MADPLDDFASALAALRRRIVDELTPNAYCGFELEAGIELAAVLEILGASQDEIAAAVERAGTEETKRAQR